MICDKRKSNLQQLKSMVIGKKNSKFLNIAKKLTIIMSKMNYYFLNYIFSIPTL